MTAKAFVFSEMGDGTPATPKPYVAITVYGVPVPQGSKTAHPYKSGDKLKVAVHEGKKSETLKEWRKSIRDEVRSWLKANGAPKPIDAPVILDLTFYVRRPASAKRSVIFPATRPDCDKLCRSVSDALSEVIYTDDSRIVTLRVRKRFAVNSPPRVEIELRLATASDL